MPQTAMTVSAATEDEIATVSTELPDAPEEILDDTSQEDLEEPEEEQGEEEQEETEEPETPQTPVTPSTENEGEGEESEDVQEEDQAPAEEQQPTGDSSEAETEPVVSEEEVSEEETSSVNTEGEPMPLETGKTVTVRISDTEATLTAPTEGETDYTAAGTGAKVTFTGGLKTGEDGSAITTDENDLVFKVEAKENYQLERVAYEITGGSEEQEATLSANKKSADVTISGSDISGDVAITVTVKQLHTVTFTVESGATVTRVDDQGQEMGTIASGEAVQIPDGESLMFTAGVTDETVHSGVEVKNASDAVKPGENGIYAIENIAADTTVTVTPIEIWSTVTINTATDSDADATVEFGETVNKTNNKIKNGAGVTFVVTVSDPEKKIKSITCGYGSEGATVEAGKVTESGAAENTYKIAESAIAGLAKGTALTVKVELEAKQYELTLPNGTASGITWKYKGGTVTELAPTTGTAIEITATDTITLQASVADTSDKKYRVTVGGLSDEAKTVDKEHTAEWTITKASFGTAETLNLSDNKTTVVELVDIEVKGAADTDTFDVKYFALDGEKTKEDALKAGAVYATAANNKIPNQPVGTAIYLQITAKGDAAGKEVASVAGIGATAIYGEIGTVYEVTPVTAATDANVVTVGLDTDVAKVVNVTKDDHVKTVQYAPGTGTPNRIVPGSGKINLLSTETAVAIKVEAVENYEVAYVHTEKDKEHKAEDCGAHCLTPDASGVYAVTLAAEGATEIEIATKKAMVEYTVAGDSLAKLDVKIEAAAADGAKPEAKKEAPNTYLLGSGDKYYVSATEKVEEDKEPTIKKIEADSSAKAEDKFKWNSNVEKYQFTPKKSDTADKTITFTATEKANKAVTFVTTGAELEANAIKTGAYKSLKDGVVVEKPATEFGHIATSYEVYEGTGFSFRLQTKANYVIDKVTYVVDGETKTIEPEAGSYSLASVDADTEITVTTKLDKESAYGIKVKENPYITDATISWAGTDTLDDTLTVGEETLKLLPDTNTAETVNVAFTAKAGYSVIGVKNGTADVAKPEGKQYYQVKLTKGQTAELDVTVKADANTAADKYLTLVPKGSGIKIEVTPATLPVVGTDAYDNNIYKMAKTVKDAQGNVTTQGTDEITVDVTVAEGYTLNSAAAVAEGAVALGEKDGKHTFTINAYDVTSESQETPTAYTFTASKRMVTLKKANGSNDITVKKSAKVGGSYVSVPFYGSGAEASVDNGDQILVTVKPGDKLLVNGKEVTLSNNSYTEVVELGKGLNADGTAAGDIYTFKAVAKEEYKVEYKITRNGVEGNRKTVDGSEIDVTYGDKVTLSLVNPDADSKILSAKVTGEGTPASTAAVQKESESSQANVAVVDVKDGGTPFEVVLTVETDSESEYKTTELAPISFSTQTTVTDVSVKGIQKGKVNKLDATSRMTYPLTLKSGRVALNAKDYENMLTVAAADTAVAEVAIDGGNLVIETKTTGQTAVTIKSVTQTGAEDSLFTFTVEGQDPKKKLKVKSLASSAQGMNDLYLDMTPDAGIKEVSSAFKYYYEVNVAWKKGNDETAANHNTGYYYYPATVIDNKLQALSQNMVVNKIDAGTNGDKCGNTYTFSAKMIAVKADSSVTTGSAQASAYTLKEGEFASEKALVKDFSTRNKYYEDKLGVTKKTTKLYSGQEDVVVAVPKFSKNASHIDDVKVTVCNTDGTEYYSDGYGYNITPRWDKETNTITMSVGKYVTPTKYNLLIEATAHNSAAENGGVVYDMYRSQATAAITVVRGITDISVDAPRQIAVLGKDASITLKPIGYNDNGNWSYKAATQKFTYKLDGTSNPKNKDNVIVKNNKITVKKSFLVGADPEQNEFTVEITPADYVGNRHKTSVIIEVTNEALVPTEIYLADNKGEALPTSLTTLEADEADVVVKAGNRTVSNSLLTFTPAYNGKKTGISHGMLYVNGKSTLSLKATTKDGGKKSVTKREKYNIAYPTDVTYSVSATNSNDVGIYLKDGKYQYADTGNGLLYVQVNAENSKYNDPSNSEAYTKYFNYSVSVSGGKIVDKYVAGGYYAIAPNKKEMTITVVDKANRNKKIPFTFVNTNFKEAKAPAASTKDKLYLAYDEPDEYGYTTVKSQELTFTVKNNTAGYNCVKFTAADRKSRNIVSLNGEYKIENDGTFKIENVTPWEVGTAKYNLVYGTKKNGIFYPATKAATISVKVNKLANMKPATKFTINPVESLGAQITYKPVDGVMYFDRVVSANVSGRKNRFFEFFEVSGNKLQIKAEMYTKLSTALALDAKNGNADFNPKEDLIGYLEYHYYTVNGRVDKADKITVTIKENQNVKYAASAVNVLGVSGVEAVTAVTLGKSEVKIASAKAVTDGWTATAVKDGEATTNLVTLKCTGTPARGKVEFYVIPADSPQKTSTDYEKYGVKVSANVTVLADDDSAKVKVDTKKNLTHTAAITDTTVTLTAEAVQGEAFSLVAGGYVISKAEKAAAAESATDAEKAVADAVKTIAMKETAEGEAPTIVITLDRDKAIAAANKGIITVPVKLTFDKGTVKEELISLKVKLSAVPTAAQVSDVVKAALNEHELTAEQIATPAAAKTAMEAYAANNVEIDPMSGIKIEKIEAKDADASKWGEGEGKSYAMNVTLKDVTAKDGAEPIAPVEITVKKAAAEISLTTAVTEAADLIVGTKSEDAAVAATQLLVTETTTADQIAAHLQAAVAKSTYEDKAYALVLVEVTGVTPATESQMGTFSYSYKVVHSLKSKWSTPLVSETFEDVTLPKKAASTPAT